MSFLPELVKELNFIRTKPKEYAEKVRKYKEYFKGNILRIPGTNIGIRTNEGPDAYEEAAKFLDTAEALEPLEPSKGLMKIADEFLAMIQKTEPSELGKIDMEAIIDKFGSFTGNFSRAMEFGGGSPEQVVMNLTVSDGDKSRGQRNTIFNSNLKRVGVATGKHDTYRNCTVIVSCTKFKNTVDEDDSVKFDEQSSTSSPSGETTHKPPEQPKKEQEKPEQPKPAPEQPKPAAEQPKKEQEKPKPAAEQPKPAPEKPKPATEQPKKEQEKPKPSEEQPKKEQEKPEPAPEQPKSTTTGAEKPKEVPLGTHKEEDVVSVDRQEKIIIDHGKKKKLITLTKKMKDGTIEKQTIKENLK